MVFGNRKKKKDDSASVEAEAATDQGQQGAAGESGTEDGDKVGQDRRRPRLKEGERLISVVGESVPSTALDKVSKNTAFTFAGQAHTVEHEGRSVSMPAGRRGVVLVLSAQDPAIGGLGRKFSGHPDKGSIINSILGDSIEIIASQEMIEQEMLGIIPTAKSLARMDEFSMLVNAQYRWAVVDLTAAEIVMVPGKDATLQQAADVLQRRTEVYELVDREWIDVEKEAGEAGEVSEAEIPLSETVRPGSPAGAAPVGSFGKSVRGSTADPAVDDDPFASVVAEPEELSEQELAELDDESVPEELLDDGAEPDFDPESQMGGYPEDDWYGGDDEDDEDEDDEGFLSEPGDEEDEEDDSDAEPEVEGPDYSEVDPVSREEELQTLERRFLNDELGLTVGLDTFMAHFAQSPQLVEFPVEAQPGDWLGGQVALLAQQANADLAGLQQSVMDRLRAKFMDLGSDVVGLIAQEFDTQDPDRPYGALMAAVKVDAQRARDDAERIVVEERRSIEEEYAGARDRYANAQREAAAVRYDQQNGPRLQSDLAAVQDRVIAGAERLTQDQMATILRMRRSEATMRFDLGMNRVLSALLDEYEVGMDQVLAAHKEHSDRIRDFIDQNRKADIAYATSLQEQLDRENKVETLREQFERDMAATKSAHESERVRLEAEIKQLSDTFEARVEDKGKEWAELFKAVKAQRDEAEDRAAAAERGRADHEHAAEVAKRDYAQQMVDEQSNAYQVQLAASRRLTWILALVGFFAGIGLALLLVYFMIG